MKPVRVIGCVVVGAIALFAWACGDPATEEVRALRPLRHQVVGYLGGGTTRTFSGTAETGSVVNLSFRSGGVITELNMRVGQAVAQGQLLGRLDNVAARLAYEQAVSSQNSAASQMNTARLTLDRVRALYENGTAALSEYENARNSFRTAEASFQSAERSVEIQEEQMRYGFIYAPEAGIIATVLVELNENVSAGQGVGSLNAGSDMRIGLGLPESVITRVEEGMEVDLTFTAIPDAHFTGRVVEVSPSADANTSTYPVRVAILSPSDQIRPGMAANVTFQLGDPDRQQSVVVVPANAVGEDGDGRFVFLVEGGGSRVASVRKQHVTIGRLTAEGFEILEGLAAGQTIATAGLQTLLDGQEVRLESP